MNVTVVAVDGSPADQTFLSVRVGDTKRLRPFKVGERFAFQKGAESVGLLQLDIYQKLDSQVLYGLRDVPLQSEATQRCLRFATCPNGAPLSVTLSLASEDPGFSDIDGRQKTPLRHKTALDAKNYLDSHDVWRTVQSMLRALLKLQPESPLLFMLEYLTDALRQATVASGPTCEREVVEAPTAATVQTSVDAALAAADAALIAADVPLSTEPFASPSAEMSTEVIETPADALMNTLEDTPSPVEAASAAEMTSRPIAPAQSTAPQKRVEVTPAAQESTFANGAEVSAASREGQGVLGGPRLADTRLVANRDPIPDFSGTPGLGENARPGFPADSCPDRMPDFSAHHSVAADILRADPAIYERLRGLRTRLNVSLASCIKSAVDCPGHPLLKMAGATAGDEESYECFREFFDPLIALRHGMPQLTLPLLAPYPPPEMDVELVAPEPLDPVGKYALSVRVRGSRSLSGLRLPPACSREERRETERALVGALGKLEDEDLRGEYFPLRGSNSHEPKPMGMLPEEESQLAAQQILFRAPDSAVMLSSGYGRCWPDARGVFAADSRLMVAWINEEDHLRVVALQAGGDLREAFARFGRAMTGIEARLSSEDAAFARSERLGYITSCPTNLGTGGLRATVSLMIPTLSTRPEFHTLCRQLKLEARSAFVAGTLGVWDVSNATRFGVSEANIVDGVIRGCARLVAIEQALERGEPFPASLA